MKIGIFGQYYQNSTAQVVHEVIEVLEVFACQIVVEKNFYQILCDQKLLAKSFDTFTENTLNQFQLDIVISIGGDGTILRAATFVRNSNIPILGINAGRLGFLATMQQENIKDLLPKLFNNNYKISNRTLIQVSSNPSYEAIEQTNFALNEVTVSRKDTTSMITIETYLNNEYLNSYWADGLIVSTPTGSTGYSLSCGGPVLTPDTASFVITPIAPHNLTARPLVIPDDMEVKLKITGRDKQYLVSLDSRITPVTNETFLTLKKADFTIKMISFEEEGFLKSIRKKLLWGEDKRN